MMSTSLLPVQKRRQSITTQKGTAVNRRVSTAGAAHVSSAEQEGGALGEAGPVGRPPGEVHRITRDGEEIRGKAGGRGGVREAGRAQVGLRVSKQPLGIWLGHSVNGRGRYSLEVMNIRVEITWRSPDLAMTSDSPCVVVPGLLDSCRDGERTNPRQL